MSEGFSSPEAAETAFYEAFAATDLAAMGLVWREESVCVHPGGALLVGKSAVMQSWAEILGGAASPRIEHRRIHQIDAADLRIHVVQERIQPAGDPAATPSLVIATNIYARDPGGWRLSIHHASLPLMPARSDKGSGRRLH